MLGRTREGARAYLAIKEGIRTVPRLGSRSSEQPLRRGDFLPTRESTIPTRHPGEPGWSCPDAATDPGHRRTGRSGLARSRVLERGLRSASAPEATGWACGSMGLRSSVASMPDRLSAPVCPGAIQVAGGQLIILGVAGGTMGGYPHVAHVISADLDRLGQLLPGDRIPFQQVTLAEARELDRAARQAHRAMLVRIASLARDL